jgi:hypothetical protein
MGRAVHAKSPRATLRPVSRVAWRMRAEFPRIGGSISPRPQFLGKVRIGTTDFTDDTDEEQRQISGGGSFHHSVIP